MIANIKTDLHPYLIVYCCWLEAGKPSCQDWNGLEIAETLSVLSNHVWYRLKFMIGSMRNISG